MFDPNFPPVESCYPPRGFESPEFSMPDADPAELTITRPLLEEAAAAKAVMAGLSDGKKAEVLHTMADCLEAAAEEILAANAQDLEAAKDAIAPVMLDRLRLTPDRIRDMAKGVREVAALPDPVGRTLATHTLDNGLTVTRVSVPLGVIAIIFESRPNVTSDAASLTFRAGSVCVLRGGKESIRSNTAIVAALHRALEAHGLPKALVSLVADTSRASANELMAAVGYVDLLIPRGGAGLIRTVVEKAKVPVIQTGTGICHIYVDAAADLDMALTILNNAKTSRPSVCNAAEVCLIHRSVGSDGSVHAYESQIEIVIAAYSAGCHKGVHHGDVSLIDESLKFLGRRRCDEAASNVEEGLSGVIYEFGRFLESILGDLRYGIQRKGSLVCELSHRYGYVLGNVDEDRSAAT